MIGTGLNYNPRAWEKAFKEEKNNLLYFLANKKVTIEHIGATSIANCRSNHNVDILISVPKMPDIYTIEALLLSKGYREIKEFSTKDCLVLVKKSKVLDQSITIRIAEYASMIFNRIHAFKIVLKDEYDRVQRYNAFREELLDQCGKNWRKYHRIKVDYINSMIDEYFRFE